MLVSKSTHRLVTVLTILFGSCGIASSASPMVPGTGLKLEQVGDDFEDPNWVFHPNGMKSSEEQDDQRREPAGRTQNGRWYEGIKRGYPDLVRRVPTPAGGIAGSTGAMLMRSVHTGIPGRPSFQMQQDDFICNVWQRVGYKIPVSYSPSCVARIYMPHAKEWENRTGPTFGFRTSLQTHAFVVPAHKKDKKNLFGRPHRKEWTDETYWPGMFVEFRSDTDRNEANDTAYWRIRGNTMGHEVRGPDIDETGWWTVGMSVTADGRVHYYISKGVDDLTANDYVTSQFPYGYKAELFKTFFFNVCNMDNGRTKSTDWIVDDCGVYLGTPPRNVAAQLQQPTMVQSR